MNRKNTTPETRARLLFIGIVFILYGLLPDPWSYAVLGGAIFTILADLWAGGGEFR